MGFFKRKDRKVHHAPPEPSEEIRETVADVASTAEIQLATAQERHEEIEEKTSHLRRIGRENALGPRFWQAVGEHRGT